MAPEPPTGTATQPGPERERRPLPRAPMPQAGPGIRLVPTGAISASSCRCGSEAESEGGPTRVPLRSPPSGRAVALHSARFPQPPTPGLRAGSRLAPAPRRQRCGQDQPARGDLRACHDPQLPRRPGGRLRGAWRQRAGPLGRGGDRPPRRPGGERAGGGPPAQRQRQADLPGGSPGGAAGGGLGGGGDGGPGRRAGGAAPLETLGRYREALRQKRELLARNGTGIEIWNELLAATAAEVIRLRAAYVAALRIELAAVLTEVGEVREITAGGAEAAASAFPPSGVPAAEALLFGGANAGAAASIASPGSHLGGHPGSYPAAAASLRLADIELRYQPSPPQGLEGAAAIAAVLDKAVERERRRQQPLLGPQRDELEILWNGHELRRVASAGERKALSLLMLAAHGRVVEAAGRQPIYLLDDADAELAPPSVAAVWSVFARRVAATGGQLFASSNRPQVWLTLDVDTLWQMEKGVLSKL